MAKSTSTSTETPATHGFLQSLSVAELADALKVRKEQVKKERENELGPLAVSVYEIVQDKLSFRDASTGSGWYGATLVLPEFETSEGRTVAIQVTVKDVARTKANKAALKAANVA